MLMALLSGGHASAATAETVELVEVAHFAVFVLLVLTEHPGDGQHYTLLANRILVPTAIPWSQVHAL